MAGSPWWNVVSLKRRTRSGTALKCGESVTDQLRF